MDPKAPSTKSWAELTVKKKVELADKKKEQIEKKKVSGKGGKGRKVGKG